jgi:hypothetical protein
MVYCYKVLNCARIYDSLCYFSCVMCMYLFIYCAVTLFFFTYRIVSCMYNKYNASIFRFLKLFLHDSKCFSPAVYLTDLEVFVYNICMPS